MRADTGICISCSTLNGNSLTRKFSHPDLVALADSATSEQYQRFHLIGSNADMSRNSAHVDETADMIDLVSLHEVNNIQSALNCASKALSNQTSWSASRGQATQAVLQLLHQLDSVNKLIIDIIQASTNKRFRTQETSDSGTTYPPAATIFINTAIEAACGDLGFLMDIVACCLSSSLSLIDAAEAHAVADRPDLVAASLDDLACITAQLGLSSLSTAASAAHATSDSGATALLQIPVLRAALAATEAAWAAMDVEPSQPCPPATLQILGAPQQGSR